jgi:hypothetical protein
MNDEIIFENDGLSPISVNDPRVWHYLHKYRLYPPPRLPLSSFYNPIQNSNGYSNSQPRARILELLKPNVSKTKIKN